MAVEFIQLVPVSGIRNFIPIKGIKMETKENNSIDETYETPTFQELGDIQNLTQNFQMSVDVN